MTFFHKVVYHFSRRWLNQSKSVELVSLLEIYNWRLSFRRSERCVVFPMDSRFYPCGFADKLKGIISAYAYAKANGLEFIIDHRVPFVLSEYLHPNYQWQKDSDKVSYNVWNTKRIYLIDRGSDVSPLYKTYKKQCHICTNIDSIDLINERYGKNFSFSQLFHELFILSPLMKNEMNWYKKELNSDYISLSFRFVNLLGDFEEYGRYPLDNPAQLELMENCRNMVASLYWKFEGKYKILVTSDSRKFIDWISDLEYIFLIPGSIGHSGRDGSLQTITKTMLDFFMISEARYVFLGKIGPMYASQFAKIAAAVNDVPFEMLTE